MKKATVNPSGPRALLPSKPCKAPKISSQINGILSIVSTSMAYKGRVLIEVTIPLVHHTNFFILDPHFHPLHLLYIDSHLILFVYVISLMWELAKWWKNLILLCPFIHRTIDLWCQLTSSRCASLSTSDLKSSLFTCSSGERDGDILLLYIQLLDLPLILSSL